MKRVYIILMLVCLLLAGCAKPAVENTETTAIPATSAATTEPETIPESVPETAPETAPETQPIPDTPEMVTVYLVDEIGQFDSGTEKYQYDENYNIVQRVVYTMENEVRFTEYYEEHDENGMPCKIRLQWPYEEATGRTLTYFADGKLKEEQEDDSNFTGCQYAYNQRGDLTEARTYIDGILYSAVVYVYDGETLQEAYCEDATGSRIYDCVIENGKIAQKAYSDGSATIVYEYDENGNKISSAYIIDGETLPSDVFRYKVVEVEASRAAFIRMQQRYLLDDMQ